MLKGKLTYKDLSNSSYVGTDKVYEFNVKAAEFPGALWLSLSTVETDIYKIIEVNKVVHKVVNPKKFDKDVSDVTLGNCRIDIGSSVKTNAVNTIFSARVGSAVHYALSIHGRKVINECGGTMAKEDVANAHFLVEYNCAVPCKVELSTMFVDLTLEYAPDEYEVFKTLQEKDKYGNQVSTTPISNIVVKRSPEFLGFVVVHEFKESLVPMWGMYQTIEDVIAANPNKNTSWILDRNYVIVTRENLDEVLALFSDPDDDRLIAFDTETTGLNVTFQSRTGNGDVLVGFSLSKDIGHGYYFPVQHKQFDNVCDDVEYFMQTKIKPILEGKRLICHNTSFDWKVAYLYDINANVVFDTMVAFSCTYRYKYGKGYETRLKALAKNILGLDMFDLEDFVVGNWGETEINFSDLPYELVRRYAPADTDMTLSLYEWLQLHGVLQEFNATRVHDLEVQFAKVVAYSEFWGYRVDMERLPDMIDKTLSALKEHEQNMYKIVGHEFNPNSPVQLKKIMYEELGIEKIGGQTSTKAEILKELAKMKLADGTPKYPFVQELLAYRSHEGTNKNFIKKREDFITPDGFIFPHVFQFGTDTGRVSIKEPNYQSYDKLVKHYIVPRTGYVHFDCDYSQIEYRVLASMAGQQNLCDALADPDMDYHTYQAARMFGVPYASVSSTLRAQSKGINFGLPYGMEDKSLGKRIFGQATAENTAKAAQLRKKYFEGQEKIQTFFEVVRAQGVAKGYTETWLGRRRYYDKQRFSESEIRRQAGNHCIQGTAADIFKMGVVSLFDMVCKKGWLGKVLLNAFIHDEILIEVHNSINPYEFLKFWRDEYQVKIKGFCKLYAGCGYGHNWYEAKTQDLPPGFIQECIDGVDALQWDGNISKFIQKCNEDYFDYQVRRVADYITDVSNDGAVIKPLINTLLIDVTANKLGLTKSEFTKQYSGLGAMLEQFCNVFTDKLKGGKVYSILPPDTVKKTENTDISVNVPQMSRQQQLIAMCLTYGVAIDVDNMILYARYMGNAGLLQAIKSLCVTDNVGYSLRFVAKQNDTDVKVLSTAYHISGSDAIVLQNLYKGTLV